MRKLDSRTEDYQGGLVIIMLHTGDVSTAPPEFELCRPKAITYLYYLIQSGHCLVCLTNANLSLEKKESLAATVKQKRRCLYGVSKPYIRLRRTL